MEIDEIDDEKAIDTYDDDLNNSTEVIEWYYIDSEGNFAIVWYQIITILLIYSLVMTPLIMVFPPLY